jgi:hypothetical protein
MAEQTGGDRLDRMENIVEGLLDAHILLEHSQKNLLKAQVLLQDAQVQTAKQVKQLAGSHQALAEAQKRTEQSLKEFIDHLRGAGPGRN